MIFPDWLLMGEGGGGTGEIQFVYVDGFDVAMEVDGEIGVSIDDDSEYTIGLEDIVEMTVSLDTQDISVLLDSTEYNVSVEDT